MDDDVAFDDVLTVAVPGLKHRQSQRPGQDAVAVDHSPGRLCAAALSDGVGSLPHSHLGSRAAVDAAVSVAVASADSVDDLELIARRAIAGAIEAVVAKAGAFDIPAGELACTLSLLLIGEDEALIAVIGDGVQVVRSADASLRLVAMDSNKEYANFTDTLVTSDVTKVTRFVRLDVRELDAVLLSSDGLDDVLCTGPLFARRPVGSFVHGILDSPRLQGWDAARFETMLQRSEIVTRSDDDLSLVIAHLRGRNAGRPVRLAGGGVVHADIPLAWPGRRAYSAAERGGLVLVDASDLEYLELHELVGRPPVTAEGCDLAWPIDVGSGRGLACALLIRPWGGPPPRPDLALDAISACVRSLHEAGYAHGRLRDDAFASDAEGRVQLRDCISVLDSDDFLGRRQADKRYVARLARRALVAAAP
jgi:serine/threonine protein phosphatase PrpC